MTGNGDLTSLKPRQRSIRHRMNPSDLISWVRHNQKKKEEEVVPEEDLDLHVRFAPPTYLDDDSDNESEKTLQEQPKYLDGGYGWVVVFYSFVMHFILDGVSFSFGILFPKIQERYRSHRVGASIVASLFLSLPLTFAPLAGMVTDAFDCKNTIIVGSIISFLSVFISSHVDSMFLFVIFFGAGTGIGMSLIYNPAIVIVTYYFSSKRGIATSLAVAGTGVGTIFYPFYQKMITFILSGYFTEWTSLLIALCISFAVVTMIGIYIRDVDWESDTQEYKEKMFQKRVEKCMEEQEDRQAAAIKNFRRVNSLPSIPTALITRRMSESVPRVRETSNIQDQPTRSKSVGIFIPRQTLQAIPEYSMLNNQFHNLEHLNLELTNSPCVTVRQKRKRVLSNISMSVDQLNKMNSNEHLSINIKVGASSSSSSSSSSPAAEAASLASSPPPSRPPSAISGKEDYSSSEDSELSNDGDSSSSDISENNDAKTPAIQLNSARINALQSARQMSIRMPGSARNMRGSLAPGSSGVRAGRILASNILQQRLPQSNLMTLGKIPSAPTLVTRKKRKSFVQKFNIKEAKTLFIDGCKSSQNLFRKISFIYFLISVFFLYMVLDVPYIYFYDYATEYLKIDESLASYLSSAIGVSNLFSTPFYGLISDVSFLKKRLFLIYGMAMVFISFSIFLTAFASSFTHLLFIGIMFGGCVTANYVMQSILLTVIFKEIEFQSAYSLTSFAEGVAGLIGPVFIGWATDYLGSYFWVFIGGSVMTLTSACFGFLAHFTWEKEMQDDRFSSRNSSTRSSRKSMNDWKTNIEEILQKKCKMKLPNKERVVSLLGIFFNRLNQSHGINRRSLRNKSYTGLETLDYMDNDA